MYSLSAWKLRHIPYTDHKISVMIQHMKTGIGFDLCLQILQNHLQTASHATCSADQMMMTVFGVSVKYMTDLIPDTSIIEMNPSIS